MKKSKKELKHRISAMKTYGDRCYICGKRLQPHNKEKHNGFTLDHVTAKSKGGDLLAPCCHECNERKADYDLVYIEKGTPIKVNGIPFILAESAQVFGTKENIKHAHNQ